MDLTALAECTLHDPSGQPHRLGDQWAGQPTVLVFLRHFG